MEEKKIVRDYLEDQMPTYHNPMGVHVYLNADSTIFISSDFPGIEGFTNVSLELFREVGSINKLLTFLGISNLEQLLKLTPSDLFELYAFGRMSVVCMIDGPVDREIWFRKHKKNIWGTIADKHKLKVEIQYDKAEDYIDYTFRYFNVERERTPSLD